MGSNHIRFMLALLGVLLTAVLLIRPTWQSLLTIAVLVLSVNAALYSRKDMRCRWKKFYARQKDRANSLR